MDAESARAVLLELPHVVETMQWGANLVFWVGDKAVGGKMFTLMDLGEKGGPILSFAAGPERFAELQEIEGFRPAPYLARAHWIAAERWNLLSNRQWEQELLAAHAVILQRLSRTTQKALDLPAKERTALIQTRRDLKETAAPLRPERLKSGNRVRSGKV